MRARVLIYPAMAVLATSMSMPVKAGVLDFLFERPTNSPVTRYPGGAEFDRLPISTKSGPSTDDLRRMKQEAQRRQDLIEQRSIENNKANLRRYQDIAKTEGVQAALYKDHTLRRGDILVTSKGLVVYDDSTPNRFRPLQHSSLKNRPDLQRIEIATAN